MTSWKPHQHVVVFFSNKASCYLGKLGNFCWIKSLGVFFIMLFHLFFLVKHQLTWDTRKQKTHVIIIYNNKVHNIAAITVTFAGCWSTFFDVFLPFFWSQELMISQKDASTARALEPENPKAWWRGCKNGGFLYWKWLFLCFKIEILDIRYFIYQKTCYSCGGTDGLHVC